MSAFALVAESFKAPGFTLVIQSEKSVAVLDKRSFELCELVNSWVVINFLMHKCGYWQKLVDRDAHYDISGDPFWLWGSATRPLVVKIGYWWRAM